jgi:hypothetical protein
LERIQPAKASALVFCVEAVGLEEEVLLFVVVVVGPSCAT